VRKKKKKRKKRWKAEDKFGFRFETSKLRFYEKTSNNLLYRKMEFLAIQRNETRWSIIDMYIPWSIFDVYIQQHLKNVEERKTPYFATRSFEGIIHIDGINTMSVSFGRNRKKNRKSDQEITVAEQTLICNQRLKMKDPSTRKSKIRDRDM
jgi:hypothetical protein